MISCKTLLQPVFWIGIFIWILILNCTSLAQINISGLINNYTPVTAFSGDCRNVVTVGNPAGFFADRHVLVIQMQGAVINAENNASYGEITAYNGAGLYEKAIIQSVDGNEITFTADLVNTYDASGKVQLVTIPQYNDVVVNNLLTALPWNGITGGVLAFEASGTVTLNGNISADGMGFRGGGITINEEDNDCDFLTNSSDYFYPSNSWEGAFKGEGIAEISTGRELGRGAQANGGGGGNDHNSGGGGGANFGIGGGGGRNNDPRLFTCKGPNPGYGGKFTRLDNHIFFGGGGGGGHSNNSVGTDGGKGGGIIYIGADIINGNGRTISANGISADEGFGDGGGGGGAGGSILLNISSFVNNVSIQVRGGNGANIDNRNQNRCFGPGGGGGGGLVASNIDLLDIVSEAVEVQFQGGNPGRTINSTANCNNSTNDATAGGEGIILNTLVIPKGTIISSDLCGPVATPVEFLEFTAKLENNQVKLEWLTASETDNDYFAVERSDDGMTFSEIIRVAGSGNSYDIKQYQTVDPNPMYGVSYYRIRQVDFDGKFSYSKVVAIENHYNQLAFTVYPNPVQINETLTLKIYLPEEESVTIQMIDVLGKVTYAASKHFPKGLHTMELNTSGIASGVYFIYLKTSTSHQVQKVKVVK